MLFPKKEVQSFFRLLTKNLAPKQTNLNHTLLIINLLTIFQRALFMMP